MTHLSENLQEAVFDALPASMAVLDASGRIVHTNAAWRSFAADNEATDPDSFLGWSYLEVCGAAHDELAVQVTAQLEELLAGEREALSLEYPCHSPEHFRWFVMHGARIDHEDQRYAVITHLDITERRLAELDAERRAGRDQLTGLLNRGSFRERLTHSLNTAARRPESGIALLFVDLDGFKAINDQLGHAAGDRVLRVIGERLRERFRDADAVARIGGDEFTLIAENNPDGDSVDCMAERLGAVIREPVELASGERVTVGASVGIASAEDDSTDVDELLAWADAAMYRAKTQGVRAVHALEPEASPH